MYELMVAGRTDSVDKLFEFTEKLLKGANASSVVNSKLGKKNLAYPIKKQTEAEYFVFNFEAPSESIAAISDGLRLEQEMVLRYMITTQKVSKGKKVTIETEESKETKVETPLRSASQSSAGQAKVKATVTVATKVKTTVKSKVVGPKGATKSKGKG